MSFQFATTSSMHRYSKGPTRLLLVDGDEVQYAAQTALLAISRMSHARVEALVTERVAEAERFNARWFAVGPFRAETNRQVLRRRILDARPDEDDAFFMHNIRLNLMRTMATDALTTPRRADGKVALSERIWDVIAVYRRSQVNTVEVHPVASD